MPSSEREQIFRDLSMRASTLLIERMKWATIRGDHAIAFSYALEIIGSPVACGEAQSLEFFAIDELPDAESIGFAQDHAVYALAAAVKEAAAS